MDERQHHDFFDSDFVDQSKGIDEKLADTGFTSLWHYSSAGTQRGQRGGGFEDSLEKRGCRLWSISGDVGDRCVELQARSATPDYPATPRTHFRRIS